MTDLTPIAAELAAITLNGRRLTPEQSSWLVGSLHHERAYCSTPGELLELLSHPTPPPAPEVEAIRARDALMTGEAMYPDASPARQAYRDRRALLTALDAAAERELAGMRMQLRGMADRINRDGLENPLETLSWVMGRLRELGTEHEEPTPATPPAAPCEMCGGRGEVGGHEPDGSWDTRPCPDCAPPAAPSELAKELTEMLDTLSVEIDERHDMCTMDGVTRDSLLVMIDEIKGRLSRTPGSEAPMVAALRERVRELKYALRDVFSEAREHIPEDLAKDAQAQIDFDESALTPLPASPAAGKEAT